MIAYQYDAKGIYQGAVEDYGLLPNNATHIKPAAGEGYVPQWNGRAWNLLEDHKGEHGYLNGQKFTISDYGPYPEGFSLDPPAKTQEELFSMLRSARDVKLAQTDYLIMPDYPLAEAKRETVLTYRQALRDLPARPGAPWDGGGENTPWPVKDF